MWGGKPKGKREIKIERMMIMLMMGLLANLIIVAQARPKITEWNTILQPSMGVKRKYFSNKRQLIKAKEQLKSKHRTGTDTIRWAPGKVKRDAFVSSICQHTSAGVFQDKWQNSMLNEKGIEYQKNKHMHTHQAHVEHRHGTHSETFIRSSIMKKEVEFSSGFRVKMNYVESFYVGCTSFKIPKDHSLPYKVVEGMVYFLCNFLHDSGSNLSIVSQSLIDHADGTVVPEEKDRTVIGIHGPKTEKYGSINLRVRNKNLDEVSALFYNRDFLVNLTGKAHIGHTSPNREFYHFVRDRVQPVVHDMQIDLLSYNSEIFGLIGTENTVLLGRQIQDNYPKIKSTFGPGACLIQSKVNKGFGFLAGIYHTQTSLLGFLNINQERLFFNQCCQNLLTTVLLN